MHDLSDLLSTYISLADAARTLPPGRRGRPTHTATILRWIVDGTISPAGERVHLRAVRMGGRWLTTRAWLEEYALRLTPSFDSAEPVRPATASTRTAEQAARELDRIGI